MRERKRERERERMRDACRPDDWQQLIPGATSNVANLSNEAEIAFETINYLMS
jgi:hypothetical protein